LGAVFAAQIVSGHAAAAGGGASAGAAFGTAPSSGNATVSPGAGANNSVNTVRPNNGAAVAVPQTNAVQAGTNSNGDTNSTGTNQVSVTNQVYNTNVVNVTNQFNSTNFVSTTNRTGLGPNDQAATAFDQALILQVRQRFFIKDPGVSASWRAVSLAANGGNILVSGSVLNITDKDQLLVLIRNTPGVVGVVDNVVVTPTANENADTRSGQRFLTPNPDPSLGDTARFGAATNRLTPPARGTFTGTNTLTPTGFTNATTNTVLEGSVGTNVIVVPVETNSTSP
jgi:hypothetical protein